MLAVDAAVLRPQAGAVPGQLATLERHLIGATGIAGADHQIAAALGVARDDHQVPAGRLKLFDSHSVACWSRDYSCTRRHICSLLYIYVTYAVAFTNTFCLRQQSFCISFFALRAKTKYRLNGKCRVTGCLSFGDNVLEVLRTKNPAQRQGCWG